MNRKISMAGIAGAPPQIDPVFLNSPVLKDTSLDRSLGCQLVAKDETQNPVGSFKGRGTELFAATALTPGQTVVCASAGNFGQGLARAAARRGHACVVFAAENANPMKIATSANSTVSPRLSFSIMPAELRAAIAARPVTATS